LSKVFVLLKDVKPK